MNMSDDVTGVTLQVVQKGADVAAHTAKELIDLIMRMLAEMNRQRERSNNKQPKVSSTDLTNIKPGQVGMDTLRSNAKTIGDTLSMSENALTKADMQFIAQKAKRYGIPVAFSNAKSKDNIFATVRTGDLPLFKQLCTELMKSKIAERPQELGNFRCDAWEIPFLTTHFNKNDLSAQFIQTADGENLCIFEKQDEKAIKMTRDSFVQQCNDVKSDLAFDRDESGYITIKNQKTGKEISFDQILDKKTLAAEMQKAFDWDEIKAQLGSARFGEEMLQAEQKEKFFSDGAHAQFKQVEANVTVEGEDPICKEYSCWRLTPKSDEQPRIVFASNDAGFAILQPEKMTRQQMRSTLGSSLHISDDHTLKALIEKAEKVSDFYVKQDSNYFTHTYTFRKSDFDLSDPQVASGMLRTDDHGNRLAKALPVTEVSNSINRIDRDAFTVTSSTQSIETDQDGVNHPVTDQQQRTLSFSDKKNAITELKDMYKQQGVPEHVATQLAKDVFAKAKAQSAEKVLQIQELKLDSPHYSQITPTIKVVCGSDTASIDMTDDAAAKDAIMKNFNVSESTAICTLNQAREMITEREETVLGKYGFRDLDHWTMDEAHEMISAIEKNHWALPEGISPEKYVPERLRDQSSNILADAEVPDLPSAPELPPPSMGARR